LLDFSSGVLTSYRLRDKKVVGVFVRFHCSPSTYCMVRTTGMDPLNYAPRNRSYFRFKTKLIVDRQNATV
jgi:hypothetical protein